MCCFSQTQTDEVMFADAEEIRMEIVKKNCILEELRKQFDECKQQLLKKDRCLDACKDTIKSLLIEQCKMERKQVSSLKTIIIF